MNGEFLTPIDAFTVIDLIFMSMLVVVGIAIVRLKDLFAVVMLSGVYSLVSAAWFVSLDAVDVAFTEAAVGAGISTVLMLGAMLLTARQVAPTKPARHWVALIVVCATGAALLYATVDMPSFGDPLSAPNAYVGLEYLKRTGPETGVPNVVSAVLASYRGYDTFGETTVILTAGLGVILILGLGGPAIKRKKTASARTKAAKANESKILGAHHVVLRVVSKMMIPVIIVYGAYVQFHGDFGPGGGFQAGLIIASAIILYALIFGIDAAKEAVPPSLVRLGAALGVLIYGGVGVINLLLGGNFLEYNILNPAHPSHGQELGIMFVEIGVLVTVASVMLIIFYGFTSRQPDIKDKDW
ncbi:MAG: cation:proton antiporter [Robiginitomaculum sp.]|nr:MAG: cation:proton antiporter [Robiginitomaculum sp.]